MHRLAQFFSPLLAILVLATRAQADLAADVKFILQNKALNKAQVAVEILRLEHPGGEAEVLFAHNASAPRIPASNLKLVTTAAALEILGKDFRFRTVLVLCDGELALIGDGDPTLGDGEMLRKVGWEVDTVFQNWADLLKKRGVTSLRNVFVDDSVFDEIFVHPSWPAEQEHKRYAAQVGGVNLNANCVDFFVKTTRPGEVVKYVTDPATSYISVQNACLTGERNAVWLSRVRGGNSVVLRGEIDISNDQPISVTVHDPPMYAATVLAETLSNAGITIEQKIQRDRSIRSGLAAGQTTPATQPAPAWIPIAIHETPISAILARANKDSMNVYAEALCKRIGFAATGQSGSWQNGTTSIAAFLQSIGVPQSEFNLDDGSGLSKKNSISANAIARVLSHIFSGPNREAFMTSLSVAGGDGTLERRFRDSDLRGRVFGKSGYVNGVSALSGYVKTKDGKWYAFSILMNGVSDIATCKQIQERIVRAIDADTTVVSAPKK